MPRTYKRKPASRKYADYTSEQLNECLERIRNGDITHRQGESQYNIPRKTIYNKLKGKQQKSPGKPQVFSCEEELSFVNCIKKCAEFGFPLDSFEVRMIAKSYLDSKGRRVKIFKNNVPGSEWVNSFLKRHPALTGARFAANIKRSRAAINKEILTEYIDNLKEVTEGVPPQNIWNYDESNLTDDPGKKRVIIKRGSKYPERIMNSTKTSISVMFCGSAAGESLPPFVVYKSINMWDTWAQNGPLGARYANSKSGWFEAASFNEWFETLLLPRLRKLPGKKVVIGDNLSTHLSVNVLRLCQTHDISFVCLPANSSHLTQPLDVAYFAPLKRGWRKILSEWKENGGFTCATLQKQDFPSLLKKLLEYIEPSSKENLISGFKTCGIYPISIEELLKKIPQAPVNESEIEDSFLKSLEQKRSQWTETTKKGRKKKLNVAPGKSIGPEDLPEDENKSSMPGTSGTTSRNKLAKKNTVKAIFTKKKTDKEDESDMDIDLNEAVEEYERDRLEENNFEELLEKERNLDTCLCLEKCKKEVGEFVVFKYEGEQFPGRIVKFNDKEVTITSMQKSLKSWKWPEPEDIHNYPWEDVVGRIEPPKLKSKRGFFLVPELDRLWLH